MLLTEVLAFRIHLRALWHLELQLKLQWTEQFPRNPKCILDSFTVRIADTNYGCTISGRVANVIPRYAFTNVAFGEKSIHRSVYCCGTHKQKWRDDLRRNRPSNNSFHVVSRTCQVDRCDAWRLKSHTWNWELITILLNICRCRRRATHGLRSDRCQS